MRFKNKHAYAWIFKKPENQVDHKGFFNPYIIDISPYMEKNSDYDRSGSSDNHHHQDFSSAKNWAEVRLF